MPKGSYHHYPIEITPTCEACHGTFYRVYSRGARVRFCVPCIVQREREQARLRMARYRKRQDAPRAHRISGWDMPYADAGDERGE